MPAGPRDEDDQASKGGPRGGAAMIGATGAAIVATAGTTLPAVAMGNSDTADGGGAAASTAPLAQHGACAQWCWFETGAGTGTPRPARAAEQKSPGNALMDDRAYAATGANKCIAAATITNPRRSDRFIAQHSSSQTDVISPHAAQHNGIRVDTPRATRFNWSDHLTRATAAMRHGAGGVQPIPRRK